MSVSEWDALTWWEQRIYLDGLRVEQSGDEPEQNEESTSNGGSDLSELQGFGMNVRVV